MSRNLIICVILVLASSPVFAQGVDTAWVRIYDGPDLTGGDWATSIAVDGSGNVYVTGYSFSSGGYPEDFATIKYYPNGDTAWLRRYNGWGNWSDYAYSLAVDGSGNVYVTGRVFTWMGDWDYATVKYTSDGDTAWARTYEGSELYVEPSDLLAVDGSGNVYVTGNSYSADGTADDYATIKYLPNGDTAWVRKYNGPGDSTDYACGIAIDGSGNVYVTGYVWGSSASWDYATLKYDASGSQQWAEVYNGPGDRDERAYAIAVDESGCVYVTGNSHPSLAYPNYLTVKYQPNGDTVWAREYDGPGQSSDVARDIAVDASGNVYVTGWSEIPGVRRWVTIRYLPNGDTAWVRTYTGPEGGAMAFALALDDSCGIYVTGLSPGSGTFDDYTTIKYDSSGTEEWVERYNGTGNGEDAGTAVAVDDLGNVYVTGYTSDESYLPHYGTIKYVPSGSDVKDETGTRERPSEFRLSQNYPNPFNPTTKIEFTLVKPSFVILDIYDVLGRRVRTLVDERLSSGYKSVLWDGKNEQGKQVTSGIYFYRLKVDELTETKRMLLLK